MSSHNANSMTILVPVLFALIVQELTVFGPQIPCFTMKITYCMVFGHENHCDIYFQPLPFQTLQELQNHIQKLLEYDSKEYNL